MRSLVAQVALSLAGLLACSACAGETPSTPSPQPSTPALKLLYIEWNVPSVIVLGDAPLTIQPRIGISGAGELPFAKVKCNATWSSSEPSHATFAAGVLEARSIGETTLAFTCRELRSERVVRVRRRLTGTVTTRDTNAPIAGAFVSIVSGSDSGAETRTDSAGRFSLIVPTEFDLQASAEEFDSVQQRVEATQGTVQLTLQPLEPPPLLSFRWEGGFEDLPDPYAGSRRIPAGVLKAFEFETRHTGEVTLTLSATCHTGGTYDDLGAGVVRNGKFLFGVWPRRAFVIARHSMKLPPGVYRVGLSDANFYAQPGCTWWLELTRPQ